MKPKLILAVSLIVLLCVPLVGVFAEELSDEDDDDSEDDSWGLLGAVLEVLISISDGVANLPGGITGTMFSRLDTRISEVNNQTTNDRLELADKTDEALTVEPNPGPLYGMWRTVVALMFTLLITFSSVVGLKHMFSGLQVPWKRAQAKKFLMNLLIIVILLPLSYTIYRLLLSFSFSIALFINARIISLPIQYDYGLLFNGLYLLGTFFELLTVAVANIIVYIGVVAFPVLIVLHYNTFSQTLKRAGDAAFTFILIMMFVPPIDLLARLIIASQFTSMLELAPWIVALTNYVLFKAAYNVATNNWILAIPGQIVETVTSTAERTAKTAAGAVVA